MHIYIHTCIYVLYKSYICIRICTYVYAYIHTYVNICVMDACINTYIYVYGMYLPVAVPSVIVTSTITSSDATSLIVTVTDNETFSLSTKYSDCSKDITASVYNYVHNSSVP